MPGEDQTSIALGSEQTVWRTFNLDILSDGKPLSTRVVSLTVPDSTASMHTYWPMFVCENFNTVLVQVFSSS